MPEKPIAESPERWMTGRSGWATQAAMAWPRPTPIVPYVPALRQERALKLGNCVRPISMVLAPSALRIASRGIQAGTLRNAAGRRLIVIDLRPDLRRIIGRLFGNRLPPRRVLGVEPLTLVERFVELADDGL